MSEADELFSGGLAAYQARSFSKAYALFSEAVKLSPKNPNYLYYRGTCAQELGLTTEAAKDYAAALARAPASIPIRYVQAELLMSAGEVEKAADDFNRIISTATADSRYWCALSYLGRGLISLEKGEIETAISDLSHAEELAHEEGDKVLAARIGAELERSGF